MPPSMKPEGAKLFEPSKTVSREFFDHLVSSHELGHDGFHGKDHWLRVLHNAREIAAETGANLRVLELFAVLHDSQRQNENHDPEHGHRAAAYAAELKGTWFELADDEMELLVEACRYHSDGIVEAHPTVQACWDSDRLDLGRVGVRPDPRFLCTSFAKRPEVIEAAFVRSTQGVLMNTSDLTPSALQLTLQKLQDDWGENFREYTVLSGRAEVISVDPDNLTRVIRSHLYLFPDGDSFDFARTIPSSFVTEECVWTLTWSDPEEFDDPSGFTESDYDTENLDIDGAGWDDPDLPDEVFERAIAHIDWWGTGEWLDDWEQSSAPKFREAPARLQPYLQNALALYRRQTLGRKGYWLYLAAHPKFLWQRISRQSVWRTITPEQLGSFSFHRRS